MNNRIENSNSSFELLRIISMLFIISHHFVLPGLISNPIFPDAFSNTLDLNKFFAWLFFPVGEVGVALFFMLAGYFCISSKKIKIKKLVLQVIFYAWISFAFYFVLKHFDFSKAFSSELEKNMFIGV